MVTVLWSLWEVGLTTNPAKCHMGKTEITHLGYPLRNGQLQTLVDKVQALQRFTTPNSKTQLCWFLGLASYYWQFIVPFCSTASPSTVLLKGEPPQMVQWTRESPLVFCTLKTCLSREPVLYNLDFSKEFILQTDASGMGWGQCCPKRCMGRNKPFSIWAGSYLQREKNQFSIEKESLAVKKMVEALKYSLMGRTFTWITDHTSLHWLYTMEMTNTQSIPDSATLLLPNPSQAERPIAMWIFFMGGGGGNQGGKYPERDLEGKGAWWCILERSWQGRD